MATRVGIMGFGRIGRNVFRILHKRDDIQVVAIVDLAEPAALEYLLKFDTVHGRFDAPVSVVGEAMYVDGDVTIEGGALFDVNSLRLYYTGTLTGFVPAPGPIKAVITLYGDFDGDGNGNDLDDINRFCASFGPLSISYDPLVDSDCDGDVDCRDLRRYDSNWGIGIPACASSCR